MTGDIEVRSIRHEYVTGTHSLVVLDSVNLNLRVGEITAVLGPSGCGKSTLLHLLDKTLEPSSGNVVYTQTPKPRFTRMPQRDSLLPWRSVSGNAQLGAELSPRGSEGLVVVQRLLEQLDLAPYSTFYPDELSGGMRQKVALARTLASSADWLLLDEPFSQIDFHQRLALEAFVGAWVRNRSCSAVLVTHDVEGAVAIADRVVVLSQRPARILLDIRTDAQRGTDEGLWRRQRDPRYVEAVERVYMVLAHPFR